VRITGDTPTIPLKRLISAIKSGVSVNAVDTPAENGQIGVLKTSCVYTGKFDVTENKSVIDEECHLVACPVQANTLIVSRMNTPDLVGAAGLAISDESEIFLPDRLWQVQFDLQVAVPNFVYWWTRSELYRDQVKMACAGTSSSMQNLDQSSFRSFAVPRLSTHSQASVANFLDEQTGRIDALISEKGRLVETVREYEQSELSRILTEGLTPHSLIPTGHPFITHAPAHWRVTAFKRALMGLGQGWSPQCEGRPAEGPEWGVLKVGCVNGTSFNANENKALPPSLEPDLSCVLQRGDVLVSRANTRELVGLAALVEADHPNLLICDKLYRLQLRSDWITAEFSVLLLRSDAVRRQIELGASGASSSMQNISQDVIRELLVALPPLEEQVEIAGKARQIRDSCSLLVRHCEEHIDRLREYRSSLISSAVAGKLDIGAFQASMLEAA
jgi:type I restriction enzyme S subunit